MSAMSKLKDRVWERQPSSEAALSETLARALKACPTAEVFAQKLLEACAIRLRDIVDFIELPDSDARSFSDAGWVTEADGVMRNQDGMFPPIATRTAGVRVWLRVEAVEVFQAAHGVFAPIAGPAFASGRRALAFEGPGVAFGVIERNGYAGFDVPHDDAQTIRAARISLQRFRARRRQFASVEEGLAHTEALVDEAVGGVGAHWACALWLAAEREFWMQRCAAGRVAKVRQDRAGVGWCNIDHHTYDGSRAHFRDTVRILEKLGYQLREMLYAGELAGWGSQVLEQPVIGSTIFADVDLAPEELQIDFAHDLLPPLDRHRRAGVLSALLGESILEAGLNHVAGLYDQTRFRALMAAEGVSMMAPFTRFGHLYQELSLGDWAAVDPARIDALEVGGHIGAEESEQLRLKGSILSHLENIERNDGFKGFNREGIDGVLRKLDPRAYLKSTDA
jgi:hypothetical protein